MRYSWIAVIVVGLTAWIAIMVVGHQRDDNPQAPNTALAKAGAASGGNAGSLLPPSGILDRHALVGFIQAFKDFSPSDQFSPGFDDKAIRGRRFHFVTGDLDPNSLDLHSGGPNVSYDVAKQQATVSVAADYQDGYDFVPLVETSTDQTTRSESNAFGATVEVTPTVETKFGVGTANCRLGLFQNDSGLCKNLSKTITMSGSDARKATSGMVAEIDGTITTDKNGKSVICTDRNDPATITNPHDVTTTTCVLIARVTKVVVRSSTAGALATWPAR